MDNLTSTALILTGVYSIIVLTIYINSIQPAKNKQLQYELDESESQLIEANKKKELLRLKNGLLEGHVKPESYQREFWLAMLLLLLTGIAICIIGYVLFQMIYNFIKLGQNTGNVLFSSAFFGALVGVLLVLFSLEYLYQKGDINLVLYILGLIILGIVFVFVLYFMYAMKSLPIQAFRLIPVISLLLVGLIFGSIFLYINNTNTIDVYYKVDGIPKLTFKEIDGKYMVYTKDGEYIYQAGYYMENEERIKTFMKKNNIQAQVNYTQIYFSSWDTPYVKFTYRFNDNIKFLESLKTLQNDKNLDANISVTDMDNLKVSKNIAMYQMIWKYNFDVTRTFIENGQKKTMTVKLVGTKELKEDAQEDNNKKDENIKDENIKDENIKDASKNNDGNSQSIFAWMIPSWLKKKK